MNLLQVIPVITTIGFGIIAIILSYLEEKHKKELLQREKALKQKIYHISILKEIQDRIGYELDIERVIDVLTGSLYNLVPYSTTSSLFIKDDSLVFKTTLAEKVSRSFLEEVKKGMLASFSLLLQTPLPQKLNESTFGSDLNDTNNQPVSSFFHIPLIINEKVVGLISVSSTKPNLYKEDEMTILYQITNQASNALGRLQNLLESEKEKILAFEKNLAQMKEDFVNVTVHDLRAPLTAVKGAADIMLSQRDKLTVEEQNKMLQIIDEQLKKLINQVSSILDAARLEAGRFTLSKTKGDIKKVIKDSIQVFSSQIEGKHILLTQNIDEGIEEFVFDQDRLERVINNLLSNSLKFTNEGGSINISAKKEPDKIVIVVKDTGVGIPKEKQGQLFAKFQQANSSLSSKGTGLGLYIVKGIVEAHGGSVSLESEVNQGTTITLALPFEAEPASPPTLSHPISPLSPPLHPSAVL